MRENVLMLPAPAKLNLFLHVLERRADGYHNLQTLFQLIDFCDVMYFQCRDDNKLDITMKNVVIPLADNLIYKAAKLLQPLTGNSLGINIEVNKNLPLSAGIGGGSSNAATTLLALNKLWDLKLSLGELHHYALQLGADVPVFVQGHTAWAEGIGEILVPFILPERWYTLIFTPCKISTQRMFHHPQLMPHREIIKMDAYQSSMVNNDFEPLVRLEYPVVAEALDCLGRYGEARMSGSGGTVFAAFDTREEASRIAALMPKKFIVHVAKGINYSPLHLALQ